MLVARYGIPVPAGHVASTLDEAEAELAAVLKPGARSRPPAARTRAPKRGR